jgi:uncharacterized tellurite resistance protein B-like protein
MLVKASLIALAAVIAAGTLDTASAAKKKRVYRERAPVSDQEQRKRQQHLHLAARSFAGHRADAAGNPRPADRAALQAAADQHLQRPGDELHSLVPAQRRHRQQSARSAVVYSSVRELTR